MLNNCLTLTSSINQPFADQSKKKILLNCVAQSFFTSSVKEKVKNKIEPGILQDRPQEPPWEIIKGKFKQIKPEEFLM